MGTTRLLAIIAGVALLTGVGAYVLLGADRSPEKATATVPLEQRAVTLIEMGSGETYVVEMPAGENVTSRSLDVSADGRWHVYSTGPDDAGSRVYRLDLRSPSSPPEDLGEGYWPSMSDDGR